MRTGGIMCGIAGLVGPNAETRRDLIKKMNAIQRHRGPDDEGTFTDQGIALGHVRLSILDLSEAGHQPMASPDGRFVISYNGEVFNYLELRDQLADTGPFVTGTDTEVILRAYAKWGPDCLDRFIGMFGLAIWDRKERVLFCARDRFGIKPFYYSFHQGTFIFASEIKAVLSAGLPRQPYQPALRDYLALGYYEHGDKTFFEGVSRLPPGHCLFIRPQQKPVIQQYYSLAEHVPAPPSSDEEAISGLRRRLEDAARIHLRADVKVGVKLSGGLDSSVMLGLVDQLSHENGQGKIEAFSCDYLGHTPSERPWIELIAQSTKRPVTFSTMTPKTFWDSLEKTMWHEEEPFGGLATAAWTGLYQNTRERNVTVLLSGNGLDEHLGGYRANQMTYLASLKKRGDLIRFERELDALVTVSHVNRAKALQAIDQILSHGWDTASLDGTKPIRPECLTKELMESEGLALDFDSPFDSPLKNQLYQWLTYTKIPRSLRFEDRMSMAYSRELRIPFLDHRLVEFSFSLPDPLLIQRGFTKYVLRQAIEGIVPDAVRWAPKRPDPIPQREWLAGPLNERINDLLGSRLFASRGPIDPVKARDCYQGYCTGVRDNSFYIWQWINLELWFQMFIDPARLWEEPPSHHPIQSETIMPTVNARVLSV